MTKMKVIRCTRYGPPEVLLLSETAKPIPGAHEVLIRIMAVAVTASDCIVRGFKLPAISWIPARLALGITKPRKDILGMALAGVVESTGKAAEQFVPGEKVFAHTFLRFGAYADYTCLPETAAIALMPSDTSFEEAAAIPFGGTLALYYLKKATVQRRQRVLIYGASGAVGTSAVQLARYFGAAVTGVCSTANVEWVRSLGADHVIDYTKENLEDLKLQYDLVFDAVGRKKSAEVQFRKILAPGGQCISVDDGNPGVRAISKDALLTLKELTEGGFLKPVIDKVYPFNEIVEAHRYVDKGHKKGNVIVKVCESFQGLTRR
jgi:NADPH:quinone reductase-like Zn-dependent oxidoreductase